MLSIINRRLVSSVVVARPLMRSYTVIPSTPQQPVSVTGSTANVVKTGENYNSVHALYNNENQSVHESYYAVPGQTYHSLSDDHHSTFGPTFNSVFDE